MSDEYIDARELLLNGLRTCYENATYDEKLDVVVGWDTSTDRITCAGFVNGNLGVIESGPRFNAVVEKYRRT